MLVSGNQGVLAVSRDGRVIASVVEPRRQIFIRSLDRPDGRILDGIDNAAWPFFSPDGKSIGFFVGSQLRRVSVDGGTPINVGNVTPTSAVWLDDQTIVVGQNSGGLLRIPASGGVAQPLLELEPGESGHLMPEAIPGTDVLLYSSPLTRDAPRVMAVRLGTLRRQLVLERGARPQYSSSGHLLFGDANQILAVPFDVSTLTVSGAPVRMVESVSFASPANPLYASAPTGTLIYLPAGASTKQSLAWVDRQGRTVGTVAIAPRQFEQPHISPDGTRVAVATREAAAQDVWLVDLSRSVASKFSFGPLEDETPVWSADGARVFFKSNQEPRQKAANGSGADEPLGPRTDAQVHFARNAHLSSASPDGNHLAVNSVNGPTGEDVEIVALGPQGTLAKFAASEANEVAPRFSPDGRWIAYQSDESGQQEIYVQAFPGPGGKWQVSKAGGTEAVWAHSGKELFYRAGRAMMSVPISTSPTLTPGSPTQLFEGNFEVGHRFHPNYDVARDGTRFLMIMRDGLAPSVSVHVEIDLHGELRRLARVSR